MHRGFCLDHVKKTAAVMAQDLLSFINGSSPSPYLLPTASYKPWDSGNMWDAIIEYGHLTGDTQHRDKAAKALLEQRGAHNDFLPDSSNLTNGMGPELQGSWAMAAMTAAERGVPNAKAGDKTQQQVPRWVDLASNVLSFQMRLFDHEAANSSACGGGLRSGFLPDGQVTPYDWKPSDINGVLFNLAARLHRFTGNAAYGDAAGRIWDWMVRVGYLDPKTYAIASGAFVSNNCEFQRRSDYQDTRTNALFLLGPAHMHNSTGGGRSNGTQWAEHVDGLLKYSLDKFADKKGVAYERWCELYGDCMPEYASKGVMLRDLAQAAQVAPFIRDKAVPFVKTTAAAALRTCTRGDGHRVCGFYWSDEDLPGNGTEHDDERHLVSANAQSSALSAIMALLAEDAAAPYTTANSPNKGDDKAPELDGSSSSSGDKSKDGKGGENAGGRVRMSVAAAVALAVFTI